jgi:hypothetical protein
MFKRIIYRDPNATGGGSAPASGASAPASPASAPASAAPAGGSGEVKSAFQSFGEGLAKALSKNPNPSQPPSDGKEASTPASGDEGEDKGVSQAEEPVTTADPEGETTEGKEKEGDDSKGWTEEDQKELKAHGIDKMPHTPETQKILKSFREARAEKDRLATSNSNLLTRHTDIEAALHAGDVKALQGMGYDLKVDQRTPDMIITEIESDFNLVKGALEPLYLQLKSESPEHAQALKAAFDKIGSKYNDRAAVIAKEQEKQAWKQEVLQETGVKPAPGKNGYQKLADQAETNLAKLAQQDPEAPKYYALLLDETKPGGALASLGINLATLYGKSEASAKMANRMAKGLFFEKNMKTIVDGERRKWEKDREKRAMTHGGSGAQPIPASRAPNGAATRLSQGMKAFMGRS